MNRGILACLVLGLVACGGGGGDEGGSSEGAVQGSVRTQPPETPPPLTTPSPSSNEWGMLGRDEKHSGLAAGSGAPPLTPAWSVSLSGAALRPVVVEGGKVFVTSHLSSTAWNPVWALKAVDGSTVWTYNFGDVHSVGGPAVVQGKVFVPECNHTPGTYLWALSAATGDVAWKSAMNAQWETYWTPIVVGGSVYLNGGYYGGLYGFNAATGQELFFSGTLEQYDEWSPAYHNGTLYTFVAGKFRAHDPSTGAILWTVTVPWNWNGWSMNTAPVFGDTLGYFISPPNLYAVNPSTQSIAWTANGTYSGTPAVANGVVYAISGGTLRAVNAASGALLWSFGGNNTMKYPPVVVGSHVYVAGDANVHAVNATTQAQAWTANAGGWLSVAAGRLFVAGPSGTLKAYTFSP